MTQTQSAAAVTPIQEIEALREMNTRQVRLLLEKDAALVRAEAREASLRAALGEILNEVNDCGENRQGYDSCVENVGAVALAALREGAAPVTEEEGE